MNEQYRINIMEDHPSVRTNDAPRETVPEYAAITERFVALLIDYGVIFLPLQFVSWLVCKVVGTYLSVPVLIAMAVGINLVFIAYETLFSSGGRVTLGKNLVGIAVVNKMRTAPLSVGQAFMRAVGYYISTILFFGGFVLAFVDDRKRALHDFLGGSVVVQLRHRDTWEVVAVRALGGLLLVAFVAGIYTSFGGRNWHDKYQIRQAQKMLEDIALLQEGHKLRYGYYTANLERLALLSGDAVQFQRDLKNTLCVQDPRRAKVRWCDAGFRVWISEDGEVYKMSVRSADKKRTRVQVSNRR